MFSGIKRLAPACFALALLLAASVAAQAKQTTQTAQPRQPAQAAQTAQSESDELPSSLLEGSVTFKLPAVWTLRRHVDTNVRGYVELSLLYPGAEKSLQGARALLTANSVPDTITLRDLSDGVRLNKYKGLAVLSDTFDGDSWRTLVWTADFGAPFVVLHRFGLVGGNAVEFYEGFPAGDEKMLEEAVADFNSVCENLKIKGQNKFESKLRPEKISELLKVKR